jgi:hypothetical protein
MYVRYRANELREDSLDLFDRESAMLKEVIVEFIAWKGLSA